VTGRITGLAPGQHGFHVHAFGDSRILASSFASHFNPLATTHSYPPDDVRHAGDMGNILADANGVALIDLELGQSKMSLSDSTLSIIGHGVIIHTGMDQGPTSQPTGASGTPFAFGKIGIANMVGNEAAAGNGATYAISNHIGLGSYGAGGNLWVQYNGSQLVMYTNFSSLPVGSYQIGFYQYGDLINTTRNYGNALAEPKYAFANTAGGGACHVLQTTTDLDTLVGTMSVLFHGSGTTFADVVSMGVISLGNGGLPFVDPTFPYMCDVAASESLSSSGGGGGSGNSADTRHVSKGLDLLLAFVACFAILTQ